MTSAAPVDAMAPATGMRAASSTMTGQSIGVVEAARGKDAGNHHRYHAAGK